ncbi:hypothetical protein GTQ99_05320 [Kineococcus sp. T13]|uniref:hypothetical protein n=1 Tax=Kineococcus vitellinus TaxID=2696565 RepID=UPI0014126B61|nr:hypothetical protein [Kineococcus vitellinus]NAZ74845.1 hypothetical protein [Kineococcus vitellinus]
MTAPTHARAIVAGPIDPEEGARLTWNIAGSPGIPEELLTSTTLDTVDEQPDPDRSMTLDDDAATPGADAQPFARDFTVVAPCGLVR